MAKFRRQHQGGRSKSFSGRLILVFLILLAVLLGAFWLSQNADSLLPENGISNDLDYQSETDRFFLPTTKNGTIVHHQHYSLSYDEDHEQAEWVAYYLTRSSLQAKNVPRAKRFEMDPKVETKSAHYEDYRGSGYDRGHLVPAADMAFSKAAMEETFFMSNISPQIKQFNGGIWRELEENVRDWAYKFKGLYIVTGPIFLDSTDEIGRAEVTVPSAYFKVLLDIDSDHPKAIAFLLDNEESYEHLSSYAISVDQLESVTGLDFYGELLEDKVEERVESEINLDLWPISKKRFNLRNTKWNRIQ